MWTVSVSKYMLQVHCFPLSNDPKFISTNYQLRGGCGCGETMMYLTSYPGTQKGVGGGESLNVKVDSLWTSSKLALGVHVCLHSYLTSCLALVQYVTSIKLLVACYSVY